MPQVETATNTVFFCHEPLGDDPAIIYQHWAASATDFIEMYLRDLIELAGGIEPSHLSGQLPLPDIGALPFLRCSVTGRAVDSEDISIHLAWRRLPGPLATAVAQDICRRFGDQFYAFLLTGKTEI